MPRRTGDFNGTVLEVGGGRERAHADWHLGVFVQGLDRAVLSRRNPAEGHAGGLRGAFRDGGAQLQLLPPAGPAATGGDGCCGAARQPRVHLRPQGAPDRDAPARAGPLGGRVGSPGSGCSATAGWPGPVPMADCSTPWAWPRAGRARNDWPPGPWSVPMKQRLSCVQSGAARPTGRGSGRPWTAHGSAVGHSGEPRGFAGAWPVDRDAPERPAALAG